MAKLIAVGDNTVDIFLSDMTAWPGGNCVNVAVQVRRAGLAADYLGVTGNDSLGALVRAALTDEGVTTPRIRTREGKNARAFLTMHGTERVFLDSADGVRADFRLERVDLDYIAQHSLVHTSLYSDLDTELPKLRAATGCLSYDFSDNFDPAHALSIVEAVDIGFLSAQDHGPQGALEIGRAMISKGSTAVVITCGADGAVGLIKGMEIAQPAVPVELVDTLGAGDAFIGGWLTNWLTSAGLAPAERMKQSLESGASHASKACQHRGAFGHGRRFDFALLDEPV